MQTKFSPSVNIIRDSKKDLKYLVTPNADRVFSQITDFFNKGIHAFTLIGSYGTGKSSFLWALQKSLEGEKRFFKNTIVKKDAPVKVLNFVGAYQSLIEHFAEYFEVKNSLKGNQQIFDALYQVYEKVRAKNGLLIISIDEFGKFLEYAAQFNPDKELYFFQQLAEFVNDSDRNILLVTTLHQNFEAYSTRELSNAQRNEWKKVKGRLKEITFNEPVEQLISLAAQSLANKSKDTAAVDLVKKIIKKNHIVSVDEELVTNIGGSLKPLDFFSGYILTKALQQYGQNERSLFTFLESERLAGNNAFSIPETYDYLFNEYYSYLTSKANVDYTAWAIIREAIDRCEVNIEDSSAAIQIVKIIGLLKLFGNKAAKIDLSFVDRYFDLIGSKANSKKVLQELERLKIIHFTKYNQSYKLFEGTDLNIEEELLHASKEVSDEIDLVKKLKDNFEFPIIPAKSISYEVGTPRFFAFHIQDDLDYKTPVGEIDGYINLMFNEKLDQKELLSLSRSCHEAILFGYFKKSKQIKDVVYDIEKTQVVLQKNEDDRVAKKELQSILASQKQLLSHYIWGAFYSGDVTWIYKGKELGDIKDKASLNRRLSSIIKDVYCDTPIYRNELINKHGISGAIHNARKSYFTALTKSSNLEDLGFEKTLFPPEKTIYITLLKETKIHVADGNGYWDFAENLKGSSFEKLWQASEDFLESCKNERRPVSAFFEVLAQRPFKLKQGFLEFWIPTFLFIKRDDFALFGDQGYVPELNDSILYLINRNTKEFSIKTFDVRGVKLNLYNRYRDFLQLSKEKKVSNKSFIESIKPFLVLYKQLPEYARTTMRLSPETISIRRAIEHSEDPERVFFEDFPKALKTDIKHLANSQEELEAYIANLQTAIRELRTCTGELTNRIEQFLVEEAIGNKKLKFPAYKNLLSERYADLKEHRLLPKQKSFLMRVNSPLDDRQSWITSVVHAVMNKNLEALRDEEEELLKDRLLHLIQEMDNLSEIAANQVDEKDEVVKVDITTSTGLSKNIVHIPSNKKGEIKKRVDEIKKLLEKDKRINLAILSELLKDQLK